MKRLFSYIEDYKLESIPGPLFKMLEVSFELFIPLVVARMVDMGIRGRGSGYTLKIGGVLVLLALIDLAYSLTAQCFIAKAATRAAASLCDDLFSHTGRLSYTGMDIVDTSILITRMVSDINQVQSGINVTPHFLFRSSFVVFGAMVIAFIVDVRSVFVFVVTIPVLCVVVFDIMAVSVSLYKSVQKQLDKVPLTARENPLEVRVIRTFDGQKSEAKKSDRENGNLVRIQVFIGKISALLSLVTYVIINMVVVTVIWVGVEQTDSGIITQGRMVALTNYVSQILVEFIKMANLIIIISEAVACINRVGSIFKVESSIEDKGRHGSRKPGFQNSGSQNSGSQSPGPWSPGPQNPALRIPKVEFKDMEFVYAGVKEPALKDISFCAITGQTIGVTGGTGSGESTLMNLIPQFYDAASGQVLVDETDIREYSLDELRDKVGVMPQKSVLSKGTLRDNVRWGKQGAPDEEIYRTLGTAQAREFVDSRGEGLDLYIDQGDHNLSGGRRQRLTIARALVRRPEILIMDDSASALDFATDTRLGKAIRENTGDMAVFVVSRRATTAENADTVLVLGEDRLTGMSTHRELLKDCQVYREICLSQLSREEMKRDE